MSTIDDVQFVIDEFNAVAAEQAARLRVLAQLVKDWPSGHTVTFTGGGQISTNLMRGHADQIEQQIQRLVPYVVKWE
jgi:hypothetical protein